MIACSVDVVLRSRADPVFVVLGHRGADIRDALAEAGMRSDDRLRLLTCDDPADEGMTASLRTGVEAALDTAAAAAAICLGDMPLLRPDTLDLLMTALSGAREAWAAVPLHGGQRGNPVLWRRALFPALLSLSGDGGARPVLQRHAGHVLELAVEDPGVLEDFDTPDRLELFATLA